MTFKNFVYEFIMSLTKNGNLGLFSLVSWQLKIVVSNDFLKEQFTGNVKVLIYTLLILMRDFKSNRNFFQGEYTLTLKITGGASVVVWSSALFQVERKRAAQSLR